MSESNDLRVREIRHRIEQMRDPLWPGLTESDWGEDVQFLLDYATDLHLLLTDCQRGRKAAQDEAFARGDALNSLRAAWNAHMETCPPAGRPEIAQASWEDLEAWRNAPSNTAAGTPSEDTE